MVTDGIKFLLLMLPFIALVKVQCSVI